MKRLLLAIGILVAQVSCWGQEKYPVSVSITTPTAVVQSGADIRIDIGVSNASDHAVKILKALGPDGQADAANRVEVRDADGVKLEMLHTPQTWLSRKKVALEPGQTENDFLKLSKLYDLSKPGTYTVFVRHELLQPDPSGSSIGRTYVPSNTIKITVTR